MNKGRAQEAEHHMGGSYLHAAIELGSVEQRQPCRELQDAPAVWCQVRRVCSSRKGGMRVAVRGLSCNDCGVALCRWDLGARGQRFALSEESCTAGSTLGVLPHWVCVHTHMYMHCCQRLSGETDYGACACMYVRTRQLVVQSECDHISW